MRLFHVVVVAAGFLLQNFAAAAGLEQQIYEPDEGVELMDGFGAAMAMDGDWAVVGAPRDDAATVVDQGAAYILKRVTGNWTVQTKLRPEIPGVTCLRYGYHVAMLGDLMTISAKTNNFSASGQVFLYRRSGEVWSLEQVFSEISGNDSFGVSVTLQPDLITIGMPLFGGKVICHNRVGAVWQRGQVIAAPNGLSQDLQWSFGESQAIEGDVLLIGCPGRFGNSTSLGRVYEYRLSAGQWSQTREIQPASGVAGARFGLSVKMVNGRALVGASGRSIVGNLLGLGAYLYQVAPSGWTLLWSETASASVSVQSPEALALSDTRLLMTAGRNVRQVLIPAILTGGTWVASTVSGTGVPVAQTMTSVTVSGDQALAGWQGKVTLTYPPDMNLADDEGQVWPLAGSPAPTVAAAVKPAPTRAQAWSSFAQAAAMDGDVAVVGAPGYRNASGQEVGCAYILERQVGVWQIMRILDSPVQHMSSGFGKKVAVSGSRVFICAPDSGHVYGYMRQTDGWQATPSFSISAPLSGYFAVEMAASGDLLAITEKSDTTQTNYVRIYRLSGGQATPTGQVIERSPNYSDTPNTFGISLGLHGNRLAITDNARITSPNQTRGEISIYDLSGGQTRLVSALTAPAKWVVSSILDSFAHQVQLSDNLTLTLQPNLLGYDWPMAFHATNSGYKPTEPLPRPMRNDGLPAGSLSMALHGDSLIVAGNLPDDSGSYTRWMGRYYAWRNQKWGFVREITPQTPSSNGVAYVRALSSDTALYDVLSHTTQRSSLSFISTRQVVAFDGPPFEPLTVKDGQWMELGMLRSGVRVTLPVRIQNQGNSPLSLSQVVLSKPNSDAGVVGISFTPGVLPPGADSIAQITFEPNVESYHEQSVEVRGDGDEVVLSFKISYYVVSDYPQPEVILPSAALFRLGESLTVYSEVHVPRDATLRWLRDGRVLAGQTGRILHFPAADKTHAGRYRLEVSQPDGSRASASMDIGIYEHVAQDIWARENQALALTAKVWGPGIKVRWSLRDTWAVSGSQTPTLSILRMDQVLQPYNPQATIQATVSLGDLSTICHHTLISLRSPPVLTTDLPRRLILGQPVQFSVTDIGNSGATGISGLSVSARGVLPGLTFDRESITGTPTKTGSYRVVITGKNNAAEATPLVRDVTVFPADTELGPDYGLPQSFATLLTIPLPPVTPEPGTSSGLITLRTTTGTGFSGTLRAGSVTRSFSGKWEHESGYDRHAQIILPPFLGYHRVLLELNQEYSTDYEPVIHSASLALVNLPDFSDIQHTNAEPLWPYLDPLNNQRAALGGRFNVLSRSTDGGSQVPRGHAISSIQVSAAMQGQMVGTLPDGSGFTSSAPLVDIGGGATLLCLSADARNTVSGFLTHGLGLEAPDFPGHWLGDLYWSKKAAPGSRLYPEAFSNVRLETKGTRYFVPRGRPLLLGPTYTGGRIDLTTGDAIGALTQFIATTLRFTAAHSVIFDTPNTQQHQMSVYAPTGFFTGSFVLDDPVPGSETRRQKRTVNYRGLITHPFGSDTTAGGGFYLLASPIDPTAGPPVTSANAPIDSGPIFLTVQPSLE